jgi:urease accessory protein
VSDPASLQRLMTFLSPAFPVGTFAWSAGLETAIAEGAVTDSKDVENWLRGALAHGGLRADAIFVAHAHRESSNPALLAALAELCLALTPSAERTAETVQTGDSFAIAAEAWGSLPALPSPCPYPIALGAVAAAHGIPVAETLLGYLTAAVHGQISVAVRLVPIGQAAGLRVMAALEPEVARLAATAATATLDDLGGIAYATDIAQMRHETLPTRLFRS